MSERILSDVSSSNPEFPCHASQDTFNPIGAHTSGTYWRKSQWYSK